MKSKSESYAAGQTGAISARLLASAAVLLLIAAGVAYYFLKPSPPDLTVPSLPPPPPPATAEERGDSAREVIAQLKSGPGEVDYATAHERAREFQAAGRLADAQLLFFFAARGKHGPAALELAGMYDPVRFSSESSLMEQADPFQAYKWYGQALEAGEPAAGERLAALKTWAEQAAEGGDPDAERLLLQWE